MRKIRLFKLRAIKLIDESGRSWPREEILHTTAGLSLLYATEEDAIIKLPLEIQPQEGCVYHEFI